MAERPGPVLVTGANSGFGLASVLRFARRGWQAWGSVRSEEKAAVLAEAASEAGVGNRVHPLVLDVSDHEAVAQRFRELPDFYGVVNNAGYSQLGSVEEVTAEQAKAQLDVNLIAPAVVSGCALPGMRRLGGGRIVMVSSIAGRTTLLPLYAWYQASKFGLEALSDILRIEVAGDDVKVSIVEPGFFKTGIIESARHQVEERGREDSRYGAAYQRGAMILDWISRFGPPPEVVARKIVAAVESPSPAARYVVGLDAHVGLAAVTLLPRRALDAVVRLVTDLGSRR